MVNTQYNAIQFVSAAYTGSGTRADRNIPYRLFLCHSYANSPVELNWRMSEYLAKANA